MRVCIVFSMFLITLEQMADNHHKALEIIAYRLCLFFPEIYAVS